MRIVHCFTLSALILNVSANAFAQLPEAVRSAALIDQGYAVDAGVTYKTANRYEAKLDVYYKEGAKAPLPVVMYIHGGGWVEGTKEGAQMELLPYLTMGFSVVNVEYRLGRVSLAPAAVEDCLCALHWIGRNAAKYHFDLAKLIVTGGSAGGHLALTTAMIPPSAGFENECSYQDDPGWNGPWTDARPKAAAVVDWYGITDLNDMLQGPNLRAYAVSWFGSVPNREDLARRLSPLTYVRPGLPPTLIIHGDADAIVPYSHSVRLRDALDKAQVRNQLLTVPGANHGGFTPAQEVKSFEAIHAFLKDLNLLPVQEAQ
jgi:acetyl esterase/lipase